MVLGQQLQIRIAPVLGMTSAIVKQSESEPGREVAARALLSAFVNVVAEMKLSKISTELATNIQKQRGRIRHSLGHLFEQHSRRH